MNIPPDNDPFTTMSRKEALEASINAIVIKRDDFLGNLDYGAHFTRYIRPNQTNWEFRKPHMTTPLKVVLFGEVATTTNGTRLGALGNYKQQDGRPVSITPLNSTPK